MTQSSNRIFDELARFATDAAGAAQGVRREIESVVRSQFERLVPRKFVGLHTCGNESGLGLGLFIVRSIVERHGGTVRLERTAQGSTRATVELPPEAPA